MSNTVQIAERPELSDYVDEKGAPILDDSVNSEIEVSLSAQVESYVLMLTCCV